MSIFIYFNDGISFFFFFFKTHRHYISIYSVYIEDRQKIKERVREGITILK